MQNSALDTIAAIASAPGQGGIGVVRMSGRGCRAIARGLLGNPPRARYAQRAQFLGSDGRALDDGLALWFPAPRSYTGEDVLELHGHGSPVLLAMLLERCFELGARPARAGEFSERAFLNGKLDLAQAEAVADLIASQSEAQARAALRSLDGEFSRRVDALLAALVALRVHVEAAIDFPEEEIDFLADARIAEQLSALRQAVAALLIEARQGQRLRDGLHAVIVGAPNAGKSSLLNALAGSERAIVTPIPGTTRDLLRESIVVDGITLTLVDTAGLRDAGDAVEAEGVRRARQELTRADLVLLVVDPSSALDAKSLRAECQEGCALLWVHSKCDLEDGVARREQRAGEVHLWLSAQSGAGLDLLRAELKRAAGGNAEGSGGSFSARARHVAALQRVAQHLADGEARLRVDHAGELLAEELRLAQQALAEITGAYHSDALLGEIFASFCIGK